MDFFFFSVFFAPLCLSKVSVGGLAVAILALFFF